MNKIKIIEIKKLIAHEKVNSGNLQKVKHQIRTSHYFTKPIIVDDKNFIILDGHHRVKILKNLGYNKIPAYLVDYQKSNIRVTCRRRNILLTKKDIINRALDGKPYPYKTSRHLIPHRPKNLKIKLEKLR